MIHVVGDSHVCFFGGIDKIPNDGINPNFKIYYLGAPLAYNLGKFNTSWRAKEKISDILVKVAIDDKIVFCMGEVDCRYHIKNQSIKQKREISEVIKECVNCYICGIKDFNIPQKTGVWAPIASTWLTEKEASKDRWILGSCLERNIITKLFNDCLKQACIKNDISFFSIFDSLCQNGTTNVYYYLDTVHLSQKAMAMTIEKFKEWL